MTEIRLRWRADVLHHDFLKVDGNWIDATPDSLRELRSVRDVFVEVYGFDSHWIEERRGASSAMHSQYG